MNRALLLMFVVLMFLYTTGFEADRYMTDTAHNRLKEAMNRGAHDASLQVYSESLSEGVVIFEQPAAKQAFLRGLQGNLQLSESLDPKPGTLFASAPEIIFEDYVDDVTPGVSFPYTYVRTDRKIVRVMKGPAVVYQVRIRMPRAHAFSFDGYVYKTVIFEYPLDGGIVI